MATIASGTTGACNGYSIRIVDEAPAVQSPPATLSLDDVADPNFKEFVAVVSDHVLSVACSGKKPSQLANSDNADVQLLFVRRPLVKQAVGVAEVPPAADELRGADLRRLDSPWTRLQICRGQGCRVRAVFIWNERQFLRDQAVLAAGRAVGDGAPVSFDGEVLARYSREYAEAVVLASPETHKAALERLKSRIPAEILWLYRHAVQSTRADFSVFATAALEATVAQARQGYANIVIALFDRCLKSAAGTSEHFESVLDLKGIANLESYRIETLL